MLDINSHRRVRQYVLQCLCDLLTDRWIGASSMSFFLFFPLVSSVCSAYPSLFYCLSIIVNTPDVKGTPCAGVALPCKLTAIMWFSLRKCGANNKGWICIQMSYLQCYLRMVLLNLHEGV